jgi:plasmid maintenance system antidote protein VapI
MENKDIKDFQSVSTVSELDNILLVQSSGIGGKMTVALFKTAVRNDVTPSIKDNVWWIGTVNTGVVAAGKTPEFRKGDLGIEWKYTTETAWKLLVNYESISLTFDDLTEAQKDSLKLHFSDLTEADIAELQQPAQDMIAELENTNTSITAAEALRVEAEKKRQTDTAAAVKSATDAASKANTAAENVEDGKTPSFAIGTVSQGSSASATVTADGTDTSGNPKYKINLVLPQGDKGDTGKTPVLEIGSTTTGDPGTQASATLTANGTTTSGNPKYLLSLTIPRGDKGLPGEGSGNVSASGSGLVSGKKYLFVPAGNNSTEGSFVEYTAPTIPEQVQPDWNAASGKGAILNKPTIPTKVSQLTNDSNYASKTYVDEEIDKIPTPDVSAQIGAHNTSETAHPYIRSLIADYLSTAKGYADEKIAALIGTAPEILDTLGELADAIVNNQEAVTAINNAISQKLGKTEAQNLYVALQGYVAYSQAEKNKLAGIQANANNFPDAPSDNKQYGRKNGAWSEVDAGTGNVKFYDLLWIANAAESGSCTQAQYDSLIEAINNNCYFGVPVNMYVQSNGDVIVSMFAGDGETSMMVIQEYVVSSSLTVSTSDGAIYSSYRQIDNVVGDSNGNASLALRMNMLHVVTNCTRLSVYIGLAEGNEGIFQFTCGSTPVTLVMPSTVKWINEPTIEANKTYQVSVLNNIAVIGGVQ